MGGWVVGWMGGWVGLSSCVEEEGVGKGGVWIYLSLEAKNTN
jgi:hypothetical protein